MSLHEPKPMPAARELHYIAASKDVNDFGVVFTIDTK